MHDLKKILKQEDTVLFIGSGISLWSGLPSWTGLIEELAKFVESAGVNAELIRAEATRGDLLQAASYGFDKLTKQQIGDFIRAACRYGVAKPQDIHRKIVSLGARCFVTTNYDNLLEEALRTWQPNRFFRPPITNRQLTETAEIVHARAKDFVFKPHGDAADSESIILTREQYRQLLPNGERQHALESLKMILASRPVVYLGFGLRDPDFIFVRDLLANTYKGGTRDHYAVMADVTEAESDYWRRNYGIHLVSYATTLDDDGNKLHTELLTLLDSLLEPAFEIPSPDLNGTASELSTSDLVLSLARHAARLARMPKETPELPIRVNAESAALKRNSPYHKHNKYDHYPIEKFLDAGPDRAILVGLPGAGKTYALRQAAARLAERLHEVCLSEPFDEASVVIPIFVDLKLYRGELAELVGQSLPSSLPLVEMTKRFRVKVFLDSFNEMPREYWESGSYEKDFADFTYINGDSSMIIGSRTNDGLSKLEFQTYYLDQIDDTIVTAELARMGIYIEGRFDREIRSLLQNPFYFHLVISGAVIVPKLAHPRDIFQSFFANIDHAIVARFGKPYRIEEALSIAAYDAINRGEEAYPLSDLLRVIRTNAEAVGMDGIDALDIANWLVSTSVLIPHIGGRIAFIHQSVTEYLAAKELARRFQNNRRILRDNLVLTRWDQSLFLTLSLLPPSQAQAFFDDVVRADLPLALNAVKYLEIGRDDVVSKLLTEIPERIRELGQFDRRIERIVESSLPLTDIHEPQLRELMKLRNTVGGAAAKRLIAMKGPVIKDELLHEFIEARSDYNYCCNGLAIGLKPFAAHEDVKKLVELADSISSEVTADSDDNTAHGFISGVAAFLGDIDISIVKQGFLPSASSTPVPEIHARVLCDILLEKSSTAALELAGDLLLRGISKACTAISFIARPGKAIQELSWASFNHHHLNRLISILDDPEDGSWAVKSLKCLCSGRPDLAEVLRVHASERSGIVKAALLYCISEAEFEPIFRALRELANMNVEERMQQPTHLLQQIKINWAGNESLFIQLLQLRDSKLALAIIDQVHGIECYPLGQLEIGAIEWWLDWLTDEKDPWTKFWLNERMSWFFATHLGKETQRAFVREFNNANSKFRAVLSRAILVQQNDLTTDDFSADAISFLLADLERSESVDSFRGNLLGQTATERFVSERLLPLVPKSKDTLFRNLRSVLRIVGSRHGRRYLID